MKSPMNLVCQFVALILFLSPVGLYAQVNQGGLPYSFSRAIPPDPDIEIIASPAIDSSAMVSPDKHLPFPFAVNLPVDLGFISSGRWMKSPDGTNVWRLNVKSPGALALTLYFDRFRMPDDGKLFIYNPARTQVIGAFTSVNNNHHGTFATELI